MKTDLKLMLEAFIADDLDQANQFFRVYAEKKVSKMIREDHEKYMTADQMLSHIKMLHKKAEDKDAFLKKVAEFSTLDAISENDFSKCVKNIRNKGTEYMDKAIHALERLVGYKFDPEKVEENLGNVITRPMDSMVLGFPKLPNVYTTKKVSKKKKVLPKLKKGRYGTGMAPGGWHGDHGSDVGGDGSGGGDGGGGGGE